MIQQLVDNSMLKFLDCDAYDVSAKNKITKFDFKTKNCVFLGYQKVVKI